MTRAPVEAVRNTSTVVIAPSWAERSGIVREEIGVDIRRLRDELEQVRGSL